MTGLLLHVALFPPGTTHDCAIGQAGPSILSSSLAQAYAAVAARLTEAADVKAEAAALRARLEREQDAEMTRGLAQAYAAVAPRLAEAADVKAAAAAPGARLEG